MKQPVGSVPLNNSPFILDGKRLSQSVAATITAQVNALKSQHGKVPGLGVILVGENPASQTYVASKQKLAKQCGLETFDAVLPGDISQQTLLEKIDEFNADPRIDGILLQLPLPKHLEAGPCLLKILPAKDADGLHPYSQGLLMQGAPGPRSCTPLGAMTMIDCAFAGEIPEDLLKLPKADLSGLHAVVIGRSQLVGKPMSFLLLERNATVTMAHSKTKDLPAVTREADILVAAVGVPELVKGDWIKKGAVVIDVGINRLPNGKLTGDVAYGECLEKASAITPVPGGVGPMTVAMLIANTVDNFKRRVN